MLPLAKQFYKTNYPSAKVKSSDTIITLRISNTIKAILRLKVIADYRLLTGMVVEKGMQKQGIGSYLLAHCQQHLFKRHDYCFAFEHLVPFYTTFGFNAIEPAQLPPELHSLFERYTRHGKSLVAMKFNDTQ